MHKKFIALAVVAILLSGCDTYNQSLGLGAGVGAAAAALIGVDPLVGAGAGLATVVLCDEGVICNNY